jgi:hypothetical protein
LRVPLATSCKPPASNSPAIGGICTARNTSFFTSQVVLDEIADGERAMAERRLELMASLPLLISTPDAETLAADVLRSGLLPAIVGRLRRLVAKQGYTLPEIYTPEELLGE